MRNGIGRKLKVVLGAGTLLVAAASPAFGQKTGSTNRGAPTVTQSIAFEQDTLELKYTAITWAGGQWAAELANEATKADKRNEINNLAKERPLGSFKNSVDVTIGGQKVAAGTYKLAFTLDDAFKWQLTLTSDAGTISCPLDLKAADEEVKRLSVGLRAGEKNKTAELVIAFGKQRGTLAVSL